MTETLELGREKAVDWALGHLLQSTLWDIEDGYTAITPSQVTVADTLAGY
ncbi:hypothetical protein [Streptomyces rubiginosohelvolus]